MKLLLDEQISPKVATGVRGINKRTSIIHISEWRKGALMSAPDAIILQEAQKENLTLATYDLRTIPQVLKDFAERDMSHGGVVFIDYKTILPSNIGGLVRCLNQLIVRNVKVDFTNRAIFLGR